MRGATGFNPLTFSILYFAYLVMIIDWNWFFSSFAQSAAALIGIIGAFIISRLLGLTEKINSTISHFSNLTIEYSRLKASISTRRFEWYTKTKIWYDDDIEKAIERGEFQKLSQDEILKKIYDADNSLYKVDGTVIATFNELVKKNDLRMQEAKKSSGVPLTLRNVFGTVVPDGLWKSLANEKDAINKLDIESKALIQHFNQNLQDLSSFGDTIKPLRIVIIALMGSFLLTVIYPLHFMPVVVNEIPKLTFSIGEIIESIFSLRFVMLFFFFLTIEGIFYYFLYLTSQLNERLGNAIRNNSEDLRNIKNYSEYFEGDNLKVVEKTN